MDTSPCPLYGFIYMRWMVVNYFYELFCCLICTISRFVGCAFSRFFNFHCALSNIFQGFSTTLYFTTVCLNFALLKCLSLWSQIWLAAEFRSCPSVCHRPKLNINIFHLLGLLKLPCGSRYFCFLLGGGKWIDGQTEVCHFGSWIGTQKFNFHIKILPKNLFYKILCLLFHQGKLCLTNISSKNSK